MRWTYRDLMDLDPDVYEVLLGELNTEGSQLRELLKASG